LNCVNPDTGLAKRINLARGGKRPGAGGPKGFDKIAQHLRLKEMVAAEQDAMTSAQIEAAKGVKYLVARNKKGGKFTHLTAELAKRILSGEDKENEIVEEWEKLPSTQAYAYLLDQTVGKATDVQEISVTVDSRADRIAAARKRLGK
jgi:hypothetical protein